MDEKLFQELLESIDEAGAIMRGEKEPSRRFEFVVPDTEMTLLQVTKPHPQSVQDDPTKQVIH